MKRFILIENTKSPILVELKEDSHAYGYVVFRKSNLKNLPQKIQQMLIKNGLYMNLSSGFNNHNNHFSLHRLVLCLYTDIIGLFVHHINNSVLVNNICNLVKVSQQKHDEIEALGEELGRIESYKEQMEMFKPNRNTLAQNRELVLEVLRLRGF